MGIAVPRPQMRKRERKFIERRLARHAGMVRQLMAQGMNEKDASRKAFDLVKLESPLQLPDAPIYPICGGLVHCDDPYKSDLQ